MNKNERTRIIVDQVLALEDDFGRPGPPRANSTTIPTRVISGDSRWEAHISRGYEKDENGGNNWDLFELFAYGQRRVTAVFRGIELTLRYYRPGGWEPIFLIGPTDDTTPLLPGAAG